MSLREAAILASMAGVLLWFGLYPQTVLAHRQALHPQPAADRQPPAQIRGDDARVEPDTPALTQRPSDDGGAMTSTGWIVILPLIVLAATPVAVMLAIAVRRNYLVSAGDHASCGLVLAFAHAARDLSQSDRQATPLFLVDNYALFYMGLLLAAALALVLLSYRYLQRYDPVIGRSTGYCCSLATLGASVLVASSHFASFFLGLEILSISLYALIGYQRTQRHRRRGGDQVPGARRRVDRLPAIRHGARLRRDRARWSSRRSQSLRGDLDDGRAASSSWRAGTDGASASATSWRSCRSTCGRPTSTRARRRR